MEGTFNHMDEQAQKEMRKALERIEDIEFVGTWLEALERIEDIEAEK